MNLRPIHILWVRVQQIVCKTSESNSIQKLDIVLSTFCPHCFGSSEFLSRCNILKTVDIKLVARNTTFKEKNIYVLLSFTKQEDAFW